MADRARAIELACKRMVDNLSNTQGMRKWEDAPEADRKQTIEFFTKYVDSYETLRYGKPV